MTKTKKYKVRIAETQREVGTNHWTETYKTLEHAQKRVEYVNSLMTSNTPPRHYIVANDNIEEIEIDV